MSGQPNIVIVVADDTTPSYHGCYGGPTPTPHIDRLAREGVVMARGYCNASLCCPSRWTLFTGQFTQRSPAAHRDALPQDPALISQNGMLERDHPTLARSLREAGYFTGHIGKWHSRFDYIEEDFGFPEPRLPEGDPDDPAVDAAIREAQARAQTVIRSCAGFEHVACVNWGNIDHVSNPKLKAHNPAWFTDGALDFLDQAAERGAPFYLHLANSVPHSPDCHESFGKDHRYTWGGRLDTAPQSHPSDESVLERMRAAGLQTAGPLAGVNAGQIQIDDQIGALISKLEALGELDNTLFIYTADHGIPGKGSCHVTGQHLPFVMRWPQGLPQQLVVHDIFSWSCMVPTLAEACGVSLPADHVLDGPSVLQALRGAEPWPCQLAYHEMGHARSVIKGRYHYIANRYPSTAIAAIQAGDLSKIGTGLFFDDLNAPSHPGYYDDDQLYDLTTDPFEQHNLIADPTRTAVLAELREDLWRICADLPRPFPRDPDPYLASADFQDKLARKKAEMAAKVHYPTTAAHVPAVWYGNFHDPDLDRA